MSDRFARLWTGEVEPLPYTCCLWSYSANDNNTAGLLFLEVEVPRNIDTNLMPVSIQFRGGIFTRYCGYYYLDVEVNSEQLAPFWDFVAKTYDETTNEALNRQVYTLLARELSSITSLRVRVLDYGIGTARFTSEVQSGLIDSEVELFGVDISGEMVKRANHRGIKSHIIHNNSLPYPDGYFDAIISCYVVHLFRNTFEPFKEWFRTLANYGRIAFNHRMPEKMAEDYFADRDFKRVYAENLTSIGFSEVVTVSHLVKTPYRNYDVWITSASKL